ncbi:MAG: hypothetical protein HY317_02940 [Acidobacteria bacterium]|nr:hypothetical protein [Acidobacteriota bacterium]
MTRTRLVVALGLLALVGLAAVPAAEAQCAMCKAALTSSDEGREVAATLNRAILVMLVGPYLIVGTFVLLIFRRRIGAVAARWAERLPGLRRA